MVKILLQNEAFFFLVAKSITANKRSNKPHIALTLMETSRHWVVYTQIYMGKSRDMSSCAHVLLPGRIDDSLMTLIS